MRIDLLRYFTGPFLATLLVLLLLPVAALAVDFNFESMLSPGPLSKTHAKYENNCKKCHGEGESAKEQQLCTQCHKSIGRDLLNKEGFHGKAPGVASGECRLCHSEHQGRDARLVQLNPATFVHDHTDFRLEGKHTDLACTQCHDGKHSFRKTPSTCVGCHRSDDVHKGEQGEDCQSCHNSKQWIKTAFDHDKTAFPLQDKHAALSCNQCHQTRDFKGADKQCNSCHGIDDVHLRSFGTDCKTCHSSKGWQKTSFNHALDAQYPLRGAHEKLSCQTCHPANVPASKAPSTCNGCHKADDVHQGRNGVECQQCHSESSWSTSRFDHSKTGFLLKGAHQKATCEQCHADDVKAPIKDKTCNGCHDRQDPHKRSLGERCDQCHSEDGWLENLRFDHDLTVFPLLGQHASVGCEGCHADSHFRGAPQACNECHGKDPHKQAFGKQCETCHHPIDWALWQFDHDRQTDFLLTGSHKDLACDSCHKGGHGKASDTPSQCGSCHRSDDIHRGAYGGQCDTCHDTRDFSHVKMR